MDGCYHAYLSGCFFARSSDDLYMQHGRSVFIWGVPKNGGTVSKNCRFIMETPVKMDDFGVFPLPSSSGEVLKKGVPLSVVR